MFRAKNRPKRTNPREPKRTIPEKWSELGGRRRANTLTTTLGEASREEGAEEEAEVREDSTGEVTEATSAVKAEADMAEAMEVDMAEEAGMAITEGVADTEAQETLFRMQQLVVLLQFSLLLRLLRRNVQP